MGSLLGAFFFLYILLLVQPLTHHTPHTALHSQIPNQVHEQAHQRCCGTSVHPQARRQHRRKSCGHLSCTETNAMQRITQHTHYYLLGGVYNKLLSIRSNNHHTTRRVQPHRYFRKNVYSKIYARYSPATSLHTDVKRSANVPMSCQNSASLPHADGLSPYHLSNSVNCASVRCSVCRVVLYKVSNSSKHPSTSPRASSICNSTNSVSPCRSSSIRTTGPSCTHTCALSKPWRTSSSTAASSMHDTRVCGCSTAGTSSASRRA